MASYFVLVLLYILAIGAGWIARRIITWRKIDRRDGNGKSWFRFETPWYYLFTGYDRDPQPVGVSVAAVVNVGGEAYLYAGFLDEYFLNDDGSLDRVILASAIRRPISADADGYGNAQAYEQPGASEVATTPSDSALPRANNETAAAERFYPIDGDYFVLRYSEAITFNVQYIFKTDGSDQ